MALIPLKLSEVTVTLTAGGTDDGAYTAGTSATLNVNNFTARNIIETARVEGGQSSVAWERAPKISYEVEFEINWNDDSFASTKAGRLLYDNTLFQITANDGSKTHTWVCILKSLDMIGENPWKLRASFGPYAVVPTNA